MLKQKQFIASILVCCLLFGAIIASIYLLKLSQSLTDMFPEGEPLASFEKFHVIAHELDEMGDLNVECKAQLGTGMRLADWNDIVAYYDTNGSLEEFISGLKMSVKEEIPFIGNFNLNTIVFYDYDEKELIPYTPGGGFRISYNGDPRYGNSNRHFFVARHDHLKPPGFLAHDNLNNYQLTLGSWFGQGGYALSYGDLNSKYKDIPLASFGKFHVIAHDLDETSDHDAECKAQLGENMRLADWNDIITYYDSNGVLNEFIFGLKMSLRDDMKVIFESAKKLKNRINSADESLQTPELISYQFRISRDGSLRWQGNRHYFVERHDHLKPYDFLDHDNLNNYQLTLGSWGGKGGFALGYGELIDIPISFSKALKQTINILSIILVCCLFIGAAITSIHIIKIPNWLIGRHLETIKQSIENKRKEIEELEKLQVRIKNEENGEIDDNEDSDSTQ